MHINRREAPPTADDLKMFKKEDAGYLATKQKAEAKVCRSLPCLLAQQPAQTQAYIRLLAPASGEVITGGAAAVYRKSRSSKRRFTRSTRLRATSTPSSWTAERARRRRARRGPNYTLTFLATQSAQPPA